VTLDWMMVIDPLFTLPLLVGALWGIRKRTLIRRALLTGAAVSCVYLAARIAIRAELTSRVQEAYPNAAPTLSFRIDLDERARVVSATLDRGGSLRSLLKRFP
jgi:hypothetical protein